MTVRTPMTKEEAYRLHCRMYDWIEKYMDSHRMSWAQIYEKTGKTPEELYLESQGEKLLYNVTLYLCAYTRKNCHHCTWNDGRNHTRCPVDWGHPGCGCLHDDSLRVRMETEDSWAASSMAAHAISLLPRNPDCVTID